jgi:hypothetical protein
MMGMQGGQGYGDGGNWQKHQESEGW